MSKYDYEQSQKLYKVPFYALVMGAMRQADTWNLEKLKSAFPEVWEELQERYNTAGGHTKEELPEHYKEEN